MIPASTNYLKLLISILEKTTTVIDDAITEMASCDWDFLDLDPENATQSPS